MLRRTFLVSAGASMLVRPDMAGAFADDDDGPALIDLRKLFRAGIDGAFVIADTITVHKLLNLLHAIHDPLNELVRDKMIIESVVAQGNCATEARLMGSLALPAATRLRGNMRTLGVKMTELARAIKPSEVRTNANKLGDTFSRLEISKRWENDLHTFCGKAEPARAAFRSKVRGSLGLATQARDELDSLIQKLG